MSYWSIRFVRSWSSSPGHNVLFRCYTWYPVHRHFQNIYPESRPSCGWIIGMPFRSKEGNGYVLLEIEADDEVKTGVAAVYHLVASILNEWAESLVAGEALAHQLALEGCSLLDRHLVIVFCKAGLALLVHHQEEFYHIYYHRQINSKIQAISLMQSRLDYILVLEWDCFLLRRMIIPECEYKECAFYLRIVDFNL